MNKRLLTAGIILALTAAGYFGYKYLFSSNNSPKPLSISQSAKQVSEENDKYKIDVSYPEFSPIENKNVQSLNKGATDLINPLVEKFKKDISQSNPPPELKNSKSEFSIKYEVAGLDDSIASIKFTIFDSQVGMAHPANSVTAFNYSLKQQKNLSLQDLFVKDSNYLQTLSEISSKSLHDKFAKENNNFDEFIKTGASADQKNFSNFLLTSNNLVILFNPATVAPNFAGSRQVEIPFKDIENILNKDLIF